MEFIAQIAKIWLTTLGASDESGSSATELEDGLAVRYQLSGELESAVLSLYAHASGTDQPLAAHKCTEQGTRTQMRDLPLISPFHHSSIPELH